MDTNMITTPADVVGVRKIDVRRGTLDGSVSSQWYSRPDDQRFLSLTDLQEFLQVRREACNASIVETGAIRVKADPNDPRRLDFVMPDGTVATPNHWSFSQICSRLGVPAGFIRDKLSYTAGPVMYECLQNANSEFVNVLRMDKGEGNVEFRAMTGPDYGRVWDAEVVQAVMRVLDDGTWKVPGCINWDDMTYDPFAPVTKQSTTLYASDRDMFVFLCRDQYPIEVGKLADGSPDLIFPGAIISNSEVGNASLRVATFYMRGMCRNRNIWGLEGRKEIIIPHRKNLPRQFHGKVIPVLEDFSNTSATAVARKVAAAKARRVGDNEDEVKEFISKRLETSKKTTNEIFDAVFNMEGHPARNLWDVVQGATAVARDIPHQDARVSMERAAGKLMALVEG